jgi:hypothetical protein
MQKRIFSSPTALIAATLLLIGSFGAVAQQRRTVVLWLTGSGTATESDRGSADSEALDQATTQVNATCTGEIQAVEKTGDNCISLGSEGSSSYTCMVFVRGKCVINGR